MDTMPWKLCDSRVGEESRLNPASYTFTGDLHEHHNGGLFPICASIPSVGDQMSLNDTHGHNDNNQPDNATIKCHSDVLLTTLKT